MKDLKKIRKQIYTILDDIAGNPMIYDYQMMLFKLTIVLLFAIFAVVRGSTAPLISRNPVLQWMFYTDPNGDKTIYNIGISIIAAYIFYLVQVYIPERSRSKQNMFKFSHINKEEIFAINQYILAWKQFLKKDGVCQFHEFQYALNYHYEGALTKETYKETIEAMVDYLKIIIEAPEFPDSDNRYRNFIVNSKHIIQGHLKFMNDQFPIWSGKPLDAKNYKYIISVIIKDMERIQLRLSSIERYYLKVLKVTPYRGNSDLGKAADKL